jgi:tRNA pseudouridine55 synthase
MDAPKGYRAGVRLGIVTDTYDAQGTVIRSGDPSSVTQAMVDELLPSFVGHVTQIPPMFSALKRDGVPLYQYARAGQTVEREPRPVNIYRLELIEFRPPTLTIEIECGRGAYVRTLAYDLGERLGCGAHLESLIRLHIGPFRMESAIDIEELRESFRRDSWRDLLHPLDSVLLNCDAAILGERHKRWACLGRTLKLRPLSQKRAEALAEGTPCRAYSLDGRLIALLRYQGEGTLWRPDKVFAASK